MSRKNILIVDDQDFVRKALVKELSESFNVDEAENADTAIGKAKQSKYDLIFIDLVMPGKNGIETCRELKKITPYSEFVCFTGIFDRVLTQQGSQVIDVDGPTRLLYKPFREKTFMETACQLLNSNG